MWFLVCLQVVFGCLFYLIVLLCLNSLVVYQFCLVICCSLLFQGCFVWLGGVFVICCLLFVYGVGFVYYCCCLLCFCVVICLRVRGVVFLLVVGVWGGGLFLLLFVYGFLLFDCWFVWLFVVLFIALLCGFLCLFGLIAFLIVSNCVAVLFGCLLLWIDFVIWQLFACLLVFVILFVLFCLDDCVLGWLWWLFYRWLSWLL